MDIQAELDELDEKIMEKMDEWEAISEELEVLRSN